MEKFMNMAVEATRYNVTTNSGGPFGAVVVKDGKVIGVGSNQVTALNDPTAHAEVQAIREACHALQTFQLEDCEIYTSCEPCPMCLGAIFWARPKAVLMLVRKKMSPKLGLMINLSTNKLPFRQINGKSR